MQSKFSFNAALLIIVAAIFVQLNNKIWETDFGVVKADVKGYYAYLPLLFIYDDIEVNNPEDYEYKSDHRLWYSMATDGTRYIKYTSGLAILYVPFFFIAHLFAGLLNYPADGFSLPYQLMLALSSVFYLILGIFILRKLLLYYFNDRIVAASLLLIYAGTNLFYFYSIDMCVSHGYSFALLSLFLYGSIRWLSTPKLKWAVAIGITSGLMILIRPIDAIFLLFLVLFNISNWDSFKVRIGFFGRNIISLLTVAFVAFIMVVPQLIYWKYISGDFIFFSYSGEHFYFLNPKILWSIFSYKNGWLIYSPLMIVGLIGIPLLRKRLPDFFLPLVVIIPIYVYVIASWWCWWYGGFGNRAFIDLYPLLSFSVAIVFQFFSEKRKVFQYGLTLLVICLVVFSLFQTYQTSVAAIHYSDMTKDAYWDSFGRTKPSQLFTTYLRKIDSDSAKKGTYYKMEPNYDIVIGEMLSPELNKSHFLRLKDQQVNENESFSGALAWYSPEGNQYTFNVKFPLFDADEVYITLWIKNKKDCSIGLKSSDSIPFFKASDEYIESKDGWKKMNLLARINQLRRPDSLFIYISNRTENEIWIDDLKIVTRKVNYLPVKLKSCTFK